jgi:hypothetical protein
MKTILSTVLVVMFSLGTFASHKNTGQIGTKDPSNTYSVEFLDVSPEFEKIENGIIGMTSAFLAREHDSSNELFGSFWAQFEFEEGKTADVYSTKNWKLTDIRLAEDLSFDEEEQIKNAFYKALELKFSEFPKSSIERIVDKMDPAFNRGFNTEAPLIIYTNRPTSLIIMDGEPYYEELDNRYSKIANAAAFIVKDNTNGIYYMYGGGLWFYSDNALSGWDYMEKIPNQINRVMRKHARDLYDSMKKEEFQARIVPEIVVSNKPSELISTDGNPKHVLIANTQLHYVENTDAELFRDLNTNKFYTLFSGRWFVSDRLEGNWQYVSPSELPSDFAKIPENHEKSKVLVSVPGSRAALEAIRDAKIPYVTKKDIATTLDTRVKYNGDPEFVGIAGTELSYAVNTSNPVLMWNNSYYLVDEAVWYHSSTPYGPWQIASYRPEGVENIPADNPLYNVKYVYVYKNTDRVVYTGFTSGYTGSYIYGPTVVFGTGFHYPGWYGHFYYHHPMTYGYGIFYDPFYGWAPVYSPWYRPSFYWHWHWHYWYGYRPPHHWPPRIEHYSATRPVVLPERPTARPDQPVNRPGHPSTMPSEPTVRPSQPSNMPSQPSVRPSQPSARPSQPTVRPSPPVTRPSQPSIQPSQPTVRPSQPVTRPAPGPSRMR